jgi:DNA-binding MarR family transcriptional regulator/GNAT superfamily N-acetyltransferase
MGVLDERFLGRDRPVGAARFLFEIGPGGATIQELRERLELDSGYTSRLLRQLEDEGLVEVSADPTDRRRRLLALTAAGRQEWEILDRLSDDLAADVLTPLPATQRQRLIEALTLSDRILATASLSFAIVDPLSPDAVACVSKYFAELDCRFPDGFDPQGAPVIDAPHLTPPHGRFLIAKHGSSSIACGGVQTLEPGIGEIKRMWVADDWRGFGLGPRLLRTLESHAADMGLETIRLDTNSVLLEAITMYQRAGYRSIDRYNDNPYAGHWFEKQLVAGAPDQH